MVCIQPTALVGEQTSFCGRHGGSIGLVAIGIVGLGGATALLAKDRIGFLTWRILGSISAIPLALGALGLYFAPSKTGEPEVPPPAVKLGFHDFASIEELTEMLKTRSDIASLDLFHWSNKLTEEAARAIETKSQLRLKPTEYAVKALAKRLAAGEGDTACTRVLSRMLPQTYTVNNPPPDGLATLLQQTPRLKKIVIGRSATLTAEFLNALADKIVEFNHLEPEGVRALATQSKPEQLIFPIGSNVGLDRTKFTEGPKYAWWAEKDIWTELEVGYNIKHEVFSTDGDSHIRPSPLSWQELNERVAFENGEIETVMLPSFRGLTLSGYVILVRKEI